MSYKEYDGLPIEKAIAKLKMKSSFDEEDKTFIRARAEYFSPEEVSAMTGDPMPEQPKEEVKPGNEETQTSGDTSEKAPEGVEFVDAKATLETLQGIAAEAGLDTSGSTKDLSERINAFRKDQAVAAKAVAPVKDDSITEPSPQKEGEPDKDPLKAGTPENEIAKDLA